MSPAAIDFNIGSPQAPAAAGQDVSIAAMSDLLDQKFQPIHERLDRLESGFQGDISAMKMDVEVLGVRVAKLEESGTEMQTMWEHIQQLEKDVQKLAGSAYGKEQTRQQPGPV